MFYIDSAWLMGHLDPILERINKKVEALTNLDLETAEQLQVLERKTPILWQLFSSFFPNSAWPKYM